MAVMPKLSFALPLYRLATTSFACVTVVAASSTYAADCNKTVYLTFDTGNMSVAQHVAEILHKHQVKATFFLANEKTTQGNYALDPAWADFWKRMVKDGHAFGSHTLHHTYFVKDGGKSSANNSSSGIYVKSQFGPQSGKVRLVNGESFCQDIKGSDERFFQLTGHHLDPIWRAPGGKVSAQSIQFGQACGYAHVGWSESGFLGDELPSEKFPNDYLLRKALNSIRPSDITMAHLGIWSRKDPWANADLEPLILGLKAQGYCFGRITDLEQHPKISRIIAKSKLR